MAKVLARSARPQVDRCRYLNRDVSGSFSGSCHRSAASRLSFIALLLHTGTLN
jgi:hypothetical protein